jgi:hypothetical protein
MTTCGFRVAMWTVMIVLVIVAEGGSTVVSAADCEPPKFLETGKTYKMAVGMVGGNIKIIEVDRQTCWIKGVDEKNGETMWINLRQVSVIGEVQPPPTQPKPGQRR